MFEVVIVSNGRCPELLTFLLQRWTLVGARIVLAGYDITLSAAVGIDVLRLPVESSQLDLHRYASVYNDAIAACSPESSVLISADDILPLGEEGSWRDVNAPPNTIQALRLIDVEGRRWFDWAVNARGKSRLQAYAEHAHGTYITGGAQLWSPEARWFAVYDGACGADVYACWKAEAAGMRLVPPTISGPTLIHLERRYPG